MARQSTTPVHFNKTQRHDSTVLMSSARAGVVAPVAYIPLLPGDSAAGRVGIDIQLKEMPKPLLNAVHANVQAWFVPKSAFPQFSGRDELMHAMTGEQIKSLGSPDRDPPAYYHVVPGPSLRNSDFVETLGLHFGGSGVNTDLIDAFNLVYNFRLAAHSSRLERRPYASEDLDEALTLPPAFWPSSRLSRVVPDYERALVVGALDLDVTAGQLPLLGNGIVNLVTGPNRANQRMVNAQTGSYATNGDLLVSTSSGKPDGSFTTAGDGPPTQWLALDPGGSLRVDTNTLVADMTSQPISITLADIDKARTTQAFAKLRTAYAGNDATGFDNDDTIVSLLMQGLSVPADQFKRPWLLDSRRVPIGFAERFATDAANLDQSVTVGRAAATLALNVPQQDVGGVIIVTVEVLPERVDERMGDEWLRKRTFDELPNALRDVQRVEPVDLVPNHRVDMRHSSPSALYGYEPMNDQWNRDFTRLGGDFFNPTPGAGFTENRSNIWQTEIVDPTFSETHYLAPHPFPHDVFSDMNADAFEFVCRHSVTITGLTQIGDVLAENNDDYEAVVEAGQ